MSEFCKSNQIFYISYKQCYSMFKLKLLQGSSLNNVDQFYLACIFGVAVN